MSAGMVLDPLRRVLQNFVLGLQIVCPVETTNPVSISIPASRRLGQSHLCASSEGPSFASVRIWHSQRLARDHEASALFPSFNLLHRNQEEQCETIGHKG